MIFWNNNKYRKQEDIIGRITQCGIYDDEICIRILNKINTEGTKTYGDLIRKLRKYKEFIRDELYNCGKGIEEKFFKFENLTFNWSNDERIRVNPFLTMLECIKQQNKGLKEKAYTLYIKNISKSNVTINDIIGIIIEYADNLNTGVFKGKFDMKGCKISEECEKLTTTVNRKKIIELSDIYGETAHIINILDKFTTNELSLFPHIEKELAKNLKRFRELESEPKKKKRKENREVNDENYYAIYHRHYEEE